MLPCVTVIETAETASARMSRAGNEEKSTVMPPIVEFAAAVRKSLSCDRSGRVCAPRAGRDSGHPSELPGELRHVRIVQLLRNAGEAAIGSEEQFLHACNARLGNALADG